jgi:predicted tellurium resistance membrane protein TerC
VYVFLVTALLAIYIGWHRLFSIHAYQQDHFYVEYFMESVVFWMAVNNILSYYVEGATTAQPMSLVYAFFSAVLIAVLLMNIEKTAENQFVQECLEKKVKKQNMERFVFILINRFLHETTKEARLTFKVYSKIISKNIEKYKEIE